MALLDVFKADAFSMASLTQSIERLPYKPSRIGQMGLFTGQGIPTTIAKIEERDGILALLPTVERGAPATIHKGVKRSMRPFAVPHIPLEDTLMAEDVQDVRSFGSENQLQGVAQVVNDRLSRMRQHHEVTLEYHRIGAIHGNILDADGSTVIYNLFTEFDKTEITVDFAFTTATTSIRNVCVDLARQIEDALGAMPYTYIHVFCGAEFFDALISHETVADAYERWNNGSQKRDDVRRGFELGGVMFEEYRGKVGSVDFINTDEGRAFPTGVPNLFVTYFAPADFMETVNTIGLPVYAKQAADPEFQRWVKLHTQSNPLCMCSRPEVLVKLTMS